MNTRHQDSRGVVTLITVIIIGAVLMTVGLSSALISQTQLLSVTELDQAQRARQLAQGCLEEAVYRLRRDSGYVGGSVPLAAQSCTVSVSGSGTARTIVAAATIADFTQSLTVEVDYRSLPSGAHAWVVEDWMQTDH
jgi:hypothetical protein